MQFINKQDKKWAHYVFLAGLVDKGGLGFLEVIGGALLYFLNENKIVSLILSLTNQELIEDPHDKLAHFLLDTAQHLSVNGRLFSSVYLLSHGIIKLALIIGLLRRKLWAYPTAIIIFGLFIIYQLYRFGFTHSPWLLILSIIDAVVIGATWLEYQQIKISSHSVQ